MKKINNACPAANFSRAFYFCDFPTIWEPGTGGSLYVSRKLATYPSPKPTFCPIWEVSVDIGLGEGCVGSFPETYNDPNKRRLYSTKASKTFRSSFWAKVGERKRERAKKRNEVGGGGEKRKRFPANPTTLWNVPWYFSVSSLFRSSLSRNTRHSIGNADYPGNGFPRIPPCNFLQSLFSPTCFLVSSY